MRTGLWIVILAFTPFLTAGTAYAQSNERPVRWHLDAGYSFTTGTTEDYLDDGWLVGFGLAWHPRSDLPLTLQADLHYSSYDATNNLIDLFQSGSNVRIDDGGADVIGLDLNATYGKLFTERALGYVTAGIGAYYRDVEMTQTVLISGFFCDPWWGFCYRGLAPGTVIVADNSVTKFAWNAGLGIEFPLSSGYSWFIETRYRRIETSEPTELIPLQIGFRF